MVHLLRKSSSVPLLLKCYWSVLACNFNYTVYINLFCKLCCVVGVEPCWYQRNDTKHFHEAVTSVKINYCLLFNDISPHCNVFNRKLYLIFCKLVDQKDNNPNDLFGMYKSFYLVTSFKDMKE